MEHTVARYSSHDEAERANREYYRRLTPQQRLEILFELIAQHDVNAPAERLQRVYRIVKFPSR